MQLWIRRKFYVTDLRADHFEQRFIGTGQVKARERGSRIPTHVRGDNHGKRRPGLIWKWLDSRVQPTPQYARKIGKHLPGSIEFFNSPLFDLRADKPRSTHRIVEAVFKYRRHVDGGFIWQLPDGPEGYAVSGQDTELLLARDDLWGFLAIAALARLAEASGDAIAHIERCKHLNRTITVLVGRKMLCRAR